MSLRILLMRFGIAAAGGALLALAVTTPAIGDDREGSGQDKRAAAAVVGKVTARSGLALRTAPLRGASVVRVAPYGEFVWIHCKIRSQSVDGNSTWYLLKNDTWSWGPARYISTSETPRWCR
ncbi:SH3 domain-containing protein [Streptomyces tailanensis]|uniref:SH3 domain-containing protein n=1 Tax=Streptomyces tailanensis TaxID=2569858 RepID=UPI00122DE457|nr:SH3 domain-containing protein [Streptomyces tailanensis]